MNNYIITKKGNKHVSKKAIIKLSNNNNVLQHNAKNNYSSLIFCNLSKIQKYVNIKNIGIINLLDDDIINSIYGGILYNVIYPVIINENMSIDILISNSCHII